MNHAVEYLANCREGFAFAAKLVSKGFAAYCPATDMHLWLSCEPFDEPTINDIYEQDLSLLVKMDAVYTLPGWRQSENCQKEVDTARELHIPVFEELHKLIEWKEAFPDDL